MSLADTERAEATGTGDGGSVVPSWMDDREGDRGVATLVADRAPAGGAEVDGDGASEPVPSTRGRSPHRWRTVVLRAGVASVLIALVAGTIALRQDLGDRRAAAERAAAAEARVADGRRDAAALADAVAAHLVHGDAHGEVSAAQRAAQVARLAELGLTEQDMEQALDDAQEATAALEARRDALSVQVERQAGEDAELQACLTEVRRAVDAAFHAANRAGVDVPATREICRALAGVR